MNNTKRIKQFFFDRKEGWFSPLGVAIGLKIITSDGQVARRCRELRELGYLKSKKVENTQTSRKYVVYSWRKSAKI